MVFQVKHHLRQDGRPASITLDVPKQTLRCSVATNYKCCASEGVLSKGLLEHIQWKARSARGSPK